MYNYRFAKQATRENKGKKNQQINRIILRLASSGYKRLTGGPGRRVQASS